MILSRSPRSPYWSNRQAATTRLPHRARQGDTLPVRQLAGVIPERERHVLGHHRRNVDHAEAAVMDERLDLPAAQLHQLEQLRRVVRQILSESRGLGPRHGQ